MHSANEDMYNKSWIIYFKFSTAKIKFVIKEKQVQSNSTLHCHPGGLNFIWSVLCNFTIFSPFSFSFSFFLTLLQISENTYGKLEYSKLESINFILWSKSRLIFFRFIRNRYKVSYTIIVIHDQWDDESLSRNMKEFKSPNFELIFLNFFIFFFKFMT